MNQRETGDLGQGSVGSVAAAGSAHHHRPAGERLIQYGGPVYIGHIPWWGGRPLPAWGCMSLIMIISGLCGPHRHGRGHPASIFLGRGDRAGAGEDPGQLRHWCGVGGSDP